MNTTMPIIELQERGILFASGEVNTDKLNQLSGAMAAPFVHVLWEQSDGNTETVLRLNSILNDLYDRELDSEVMEVLRLMHDAMGLISTSLMILSYS